MTGSVYESYKNFGEKLNILRNDFQVKLDESKSIANWCTVIIFIVIISLLLMFVVNLIKTISLPWLRVEKKEAE